MRLRLLLCLLLLTIYPSTLLSQRYIEDIFSSENTVNDIVYGNSINDLGQAQNLLLDFHEPDGDLEESRPLIIWVHGGSFTSGSKNDFTLDVFSDYLIPKGYTTAHVSYRLSSQDVLVGNNASVDTLSLYKAVHNGVHDVRAAVRFFKLNAAEYRIDPERIYVAGISAGAIIGIELGYIDRLEELYPNVNPNSVEGDSGNSSASSDVAGIISLCGTSVFPEIIEGPNDPPLFMAHDNRDPIVPYSNALATYDRAVSVGTSAQGLFFESGLHCSWSIPIVGFFNLIDVQNQLRTFLFNGISTNNELEPVPSTISTFPNPFIDTISVKGVQEGSYSIFSMLGERIRSGSISQESSPIRGLGSLSAGVYLLVIENQGRSGNVFTQKIVKSE